ncbi:hypothetical protein BD779DRAFT_1681130 [Infundibulicybe gibba]|nr:hypothetical protein BD779DRAFT_1681130 [Infundibulicybe gibba]
MIPSKGKGFGFVNYENHEKATSKPFVSCGCGKAYNVIYLANTLSLDTLGIDVSHTAVERACVILTGPDTPTAGYPIDPLIDTGPPFFVCPEHYDVLLGADFSKVYDKIPMMSTEMHVGKDWMVV